MKDDVIDELVPINPEDYVPDPGERRDKYVRGMEERVRGLVRRCGRAVDKLWEKALDKDVAYEELREVVRVVDGLARLAVGAAEAACAADAMLAVGAAEAAGAADVRGRMYDGRLGDECASRGGGDNFPAGGGVLPGEQ